MIGPVISTSLMPTPGCSTPGDRLDPSGQSEGEKLNGRLNSISASISNVLGSGPDIEITEIRRCGADRGKVGCGDREELKVLGIVRRRLKSKTISPANRRAMGPRRNFGIVSLVRRVHNDPAILIAKLAGIDVSLHLFQRADGNGLSLWTFADENAPCPRRVWPPPYTLAFVRCRRQGFAIVVKPAGLLVGGKQALQIRCRSPVDPRSCSDIPGD